MTTDREPHPAVAAALVELGLTEHSPQHEGHFFCERDRARAERATAAVLRWAANEFDPRIYRTTHEWLAGNADEIEARPTTEGASE